MNSRNYNNKQRQNDDSQGQELNEAMMPQSITAEKALLGSLILDPETYLLISDILHPQDFYRIAHQQVYEVFEYLVERQEPADFVSIIEELEHRNIQLFPDEDNATYLSQLINGVPTSGNAEEYAHIIEDRAVRRRLMNAAGVIADSALHDTADEAMATSEQMVFDISQKRNITSYIPVSDTMKRCAERIMTASENKSAMIGLPTGFIDLDRMLKGLRKQFLYILAARPAMGKTALSLTMAWNIVKQGKRVAFFSLEMGDEELGFRLISKVARIPSDRLQTGWIHDDEWEKVENAVSTISEVPLVIDETGGLSIAQLRSRCRQMKAKGGLDLIIVDYLQLLSAIKKDGKTHENRVQEVSDISRGLKNLAKELDVPVVALAQLSRMVEQRQSKVPQLSDLRESGSIEADADVVMFIYREEVYNPESERKGMADIIVPKNRHGGIGEVSLYFDAPLTDFANLEVNTL